jgi:xanthine/uracil permease
MTTAAKRVRKGEVMGEQLHVGIHDKLPIWQYVVYGAQMLLADGLTALILPVVLGRILELSVEQTAGLLAACLLGAGLTSIVQSLYVLRLPVLQGPAVSFIAVIPLGAATYGLDAIFTAMWVGGLIVAVLSWPIRIFPKMRHFVSQPAVYGTFFVLVSIVIGQEVIGQIVGTADSPHFGSGINYLIAVVPFIAALFFVVMIPRSKWRPVVLLGSAVVAVLISGGADQTDFSSVSDADWLVFPEFMPFGFELSFGAIALVFGAYFINMFESIGLYKVFAVDVAGEELTENRVAGGLVCEGLGGTVGGLFGGLGGITYSQNMGSIAITRIGTRFQVTAAGVILVLMAFVGKFEAAVASLPGPVVGGLLFATVALLLMQGVISLGEVPRTGLNLYAVGGGLMLGGAWFGMPDGALDDLPQSLAPFLGSPLIVGLGLTVLVLLVFGWTRGAKASGADQSGELTRDTSPTADT